jgi:DNA-binding transcriptional ArsR family regulator
MKEITEIDDPRLVKGLAHPLRIRILRVLQDRIASPSEIAEEIGAPLGNVSYHVRFLARVGLIELSSTEPRRGAVEHYYRAVSGVRVSEEAWAQVPRVVRDALITSTLEQIAPAVVSAAAAGGFDRDDAHASRSELVLDDRGFSELSAEVAELVKRAAEIERGSAKRLAGGGRGASAAPTIAAGLVTMLFGAGDADGD